MSKFVKHPNYYPSNNDIAFLKLVSPFEWTEYVQPACLPQSSYKAPVGKSVIISGWGKTIFSTGTVETQKSLRNFKSLRFFVPIGDLNEKF